MFVCAIYIITFFIFFSGFCSCSKYIKKATKKSISYNAYFLVNASHKLVDVAT